MQTRDVLLLPKCNVAEEATYCWHDVIKNKIQLFADPFLERWLDDAESVKRFETALERVVADLEEFSPARAASKLGPIASMPDTARRELLARLDETFRRAFAVAEMRERLCVVVDPLRQGLRECTSGRDGSEKAERLAALRAAASAARCELEALPSG